MRQHRCQQRQTISTYGTLHRRLYPSVIILPQVAAQRVEQVKRCLKHRLARLLEVVEGIEKELQNKG